MKNPLAVIWDMIRSLFTSSSKEETHLLVIEREFTDASVKNLVGLWMTNKLETAELKRLLEGRSLHELKPKMIEFLLGKGIITPRQRDEYYDRSHK